MAMNLPPVLRQRYLDGNGNPLAGGFLYTYQANTETPQATYTDSTGNSENENPIELDANGEAAMWLDPTLSYKFVLKNSLGVTQWTVNNVVGLLGNDSVPTGALQDEAVTQPKVAEDAIGADQLQDDVSVDGNRAVTTNHIRDLAITPVKQASSVIAVPTNYALTASVAGNALTVALKSAAGSDASSSDPVKIPFRDGTAATGTPIVRSVTAALSMTIASGSTLGTVASQNQYLWVYAIDNAGTVELAISGARFFDEGVLQTTTAEGGNADGETTLYSTTERSNVAIRLLGRLKSSQSVAGVWASAITEIALQGNRETQKYSEIHVDNGGGASSNGSVNTGVARFSATNKAVGSAITYADSSTNGSSFTINEDGMYAAEYSASKAAVAMIVAVMVNSTVLTSSDPSSNTYAQGRRSFGQGESGRTGHCAWVGRLKAGDIVRPQNSTTGSVTGQTFFSIVRVGD